MWCDLGPDEESLVYTSRLQRSKGLPERVLGRRGGYIYKYMESMRRDLLVRFYPELERDVIRAIQRSQRGIAERSASGSRG